MANTIGYHYVKSCYGLWLPGDERGSWSEAWDDQIGFTEPHTLHPADPVRRRMAEERMAHAPVRLSPEMVDAVIDAITDCAAVSAGGFAVVAAAIESTHVHLLIPYSGRDIDKTAKWLADRTTKALHTKTPHRGPVWCKGKWCSYVFEQTHWENTARYIERHNIRHGRGARPYPFLM
jgi:REP element-mobilizing transposase RayT